jgi:hypothetical protein
MTAISPDEFAGWVSTAMDAFAEVSEAAVEDEVAMLFATNDSRTFLGQLIDETLMVRGFTHDEFDADGATQINRMLLDGPPRKVAAMATRVLWAPGTEPDSPTTDAWLAVVVAPRHNAVFAVRRWVEDRLWWRLDPSEAPWLILSSASGLRKALESAEPLVFKTVEDKRLYSRIDEGTPPPEDEHGRI